jgi:ketosteroid isomerase-like protein
VTAPGAITERRLAEQETCFSRAFASGDLGIARPLYHPAVVYLSPTVRLYGWPTRIEGVERTLEFIGLTIRHCEAIDYRAVETAIVADGGAAFVRIHFDWTREGRRLRSNYVVVYRYRDGSIGQQELYYDPSGRLEVLAGPALTPEAGAPATAPGRSR